jgi:hypothetical protein
MKLILRDSDRLVFRLSKREHEALLTTLRMSALFPLGPQPISRDAAAGKVVRSAQEELDQALSDHRVEQATAITCLLTDPLRCACQESGGWKLTLGPADTERLLQVLNEIRVGAWEKLGRPDFEKGTRPEITEENFLCFWAFQLTDLFEGVLLAALDGESAPPGEPAEPERPE